MISKLDYDGIAVVSRGKHDEEVYREVIKARCYEKPRLGFKVRADEIWLDCGANVGAFALWAELKRGAKVVGFEACQENTTIAQKNMILNCCASSIETAFISDKSDGRTSVSFNEKTPARSSPTAKGNQRFVKNICISDLIDEIKPSGLKIDIEGGELPILDRGFPLNGVRAVALEYHFRFDKSCANARRRIGFLLDHFENNSIPKTVFTHDVWPAWTDAIMFFWSDSK